MTLSSQEPSTRVAWRKNVTHVRQTLANQWHTTMRHAPRAGEKIMKSIDQERATIFTPCTAAAPAETITQSITSPVSAMHEPMKIVIPNPRPRACEPTSASSIRDTHGESGRESRRVIECVTRIALARPIRAARNSPRHAARVP